MTTSTTRARAPEALDPTSGATLAGTRGLVRLALRADRLLIGIWAVATGLLVQTSVVGLGAIYTTPEALAARAELIRSPAATALAGPGYGLDDYTLGAMTANELALWIMIPVSIMAILAVSRHLRAPEEDGRLELVRSQPVGRVAPVVAGLVAATVGVLVVGATTFLALLTTDLDPTGSAVMVASIVVVALVLASATAVAAQLTAHARTSSALGMAALGVAFVLRAIGDVQGLESSTFWTWLSPFGWAQATAPYTLDRWWPLAIGLVSVAVSLALAFALVRRRDFGTGLLPERLGRAHGRTRTIAGLTWRRQRTSILSWGVAVVLCGALIGLLASAVVDFAEADPQLLDLMGGSTEDLVSGAFALYAVFLGILAAAYAGTAVNAARTDENRGLAGTLLALPVSRWLWLGAQLAVAAVAVVVMLLVAGLVMGLTAAQSLDDPSRVPQLIGAVAVTIPAALVVLGFATLVLGLLPRAMWLVWAYVAYVSVVGMFGALLPEGTDKASPFGYLPRLPADPMDWPPVAGVTLVAVALVGAGLVAFRRRDTTG